MAKKNEIIVKDVAIKTISKDGIDYISINDGVPQGERLLKLNQIAIQQMQVLEGNNNRNLLK